MRQPTAKAAFCGCSRRDRWPDQAGKRARLAKHAPGRPGLRARDRGREPQEAKAYIPSQMIILGMFAEYIKAAMDKATYEIIDDQEPFYGEIPELRGVWATGKTLESCRDRLMSALEVWDCLSSQDWRSIPAIGGASITVSAEPVSIVE
ncbi:Uncharacterised protein [uncultured archaeon]|nr:Uncharacterised protein [uncultured archaeon]